MVISLIHPSRGRPQKSYENAKEWIEKAGCDVELIVSTDTSDPFVLDYMIAYSDAIHLQNDNSCVVEATNIAAKVSRGDVLIYLSDDFKCFDNWGLSVLKEFEGEDRPLLLKVDDCLQNFHVAVLTIPIMNRQLYEKLGYFWHPAYKSMFCDEHLYWMAHRLGAMKMCPRIKFEHQHVSVGKAKDDETYQRSSANWEQGKAMFAKHKSQGFPLGL